ncbi:MAG: hypothetical protein WCL06_11950 [Bacteroidota bacterium]
MKKALFFSMVFVFYSLICKSQDVIVKKSGDEIQAKVTDIEIETVKYKMFNNKSGPTYTILKSDIFMIKYENGTKDVFAGNVAEKPSKADTVIPNIVSEKQNIPVVSRYCKGSVQVYSDLPGLVIYLDDQLQTWTVTMKIDSIPTGSHFLKITKDDISIYSELITINPNIVTTVLIKNDAELQNKLLAGMSDQIQKYKETRLDVLQSTQYVTTTESKTNSDYYPGFFSVLGESATNTVATTQANTSWFITQGGSKKIGESEFASITNYQTYYDKIKAQKRHNRNNLITGLSVMAGSVGVILAGVATTPVPYDEKKLVVPVILYTLGGVCFIGGGFATKGDHDDVLNKEEVIKVIYAYNKDLKKKLGLPENFETK